MARRKSPKSPELTLRQVATVSGYHYAYVRQIIAYGKLPSVKRGKSRFVTVADLLAYIESTSPVRLAHVRAQLSVLEDTAGAAA